MKRCERHSGSGPARFPGRIARVLLALMAWGTTAPRGPALAQLPTDGAGRTAPAASPVLSPDHWAVQALWRATALGLLPGYEFAQRAVPREEVRRALEEAASNATGQEDVRAITDSWLRRFRDEYPADGRGGLTWNAQLSGGGVRATGVAGPGGAEFPPDRTGALRQPDREGLVAALDLSALAGKHLAVRVAPAMESGRASLRGADLVGGLGAWQLAVGRAPIGFGWGRSGGVVLSGTSALDRIELSTIRSITLPGPLSYAGPSAFDFFVSRLPEPRHPGRPLFLGTRAAIQPHPRVSLALDRAVMIGGSGTHVPVTPRSMMNLLIGRVANGGLENQEMSASLRYQLPTERLLPLTFYAEAGMEDAAGAWRDVPGYVAGLYTPRLPGAPRVDLGGEVTFFNEHCCGNPPWYRHWAFPGAWALDDRPLGHPLGGSGTELLAYSSAFFPSTRTWLHARVFHRRRTEDNLYVPGRDGIGRGGSIDARWTPGSRVEMGGALSLEKGSGWAEHSFELTARIFTGRSRPPQQASTSSGDPARWVSGKS